MSMNTEIKQVGLSYGIMAEELSKQLDKQELKYDQKKMKYFEKERQALQTLRFGSGILTDSMFDKLLAKLHKKVMQHVATANKLNINIK